MDHALPKRQPGATLTAKDGTEESERAPAAPEPLYPPGEFSRVELPGYVAWTGWVTEETYAGAGVLVVRDISGTVQARVSANAFRQVIPLALPIPAAERVALDAGRCICGPVLSSNGEDIDERPDCPVHGFGEYSTDDADPF